MSRLFLSCRNWSTVSTLMPTVPFLNGVWPVGWLEFNVPFQHKYYITDDGVWPVCRCVVYIERNTLPYFTSNKRQLQHHIFTSGRTVVYVMV